MKEGRGKDPGKNKTCHSEPDRGEESDVKIKNAKVRKNKLVIMNYE
jgi:hypothetical protein